MSSLWVDGWRAAVEELAESGGVASTEGWRLGYSEEDLERMADLHGGESTTVRFIARSGIIEREFGDWRVPVVGDYVEIPATDWKIAAGRYYVGSVDMIMGLRGPKRADVVLLTYSEQLKAGR